MTQRKFVLFVLAAALLIVVLPTAACGDGGDSLTRQEVEEIVRSEISAVPTPEPTQPGLTLDEVEQAIVAAIANMPEAPEPQPGKDRAEVEAAIQSAMEGLEGSLVTRSEVEDAVGAVVSAIPEPGISKSEAEGLLQAALGDIPEPAPGLTAEEVRSIAAHVVATIPRKSSPARYTQFVVDSAISRYQAEGLDSTIAHYNDAASIDGQWYVFMVDQNGEVVSHFNPDILGENLNGPLGTDANGYNFGPEMLSATGEGIWVSYVYNNPATRNESTSHLGAVELKHAWLIRHDDLIFGSGWYVNADEFTMQLVAEAVDIYRREGLEGTVAQFAGSDSATAGLSDTIAFYNSAEDITGDWFALIADRGGTIVAPLRSLPHRQQRARDLWPRASESVHRRQLDNLGDDRCLRINGHSARLGGSTRRNDLRRRLAAGRCQRFSRSRGIATPTVRKRRPSLASGGTNRHQGMALPSLQDHSLTLNGP